MAFVNEYISEADKKKFDFESLNRRPRKAGTTPSLSWTVDREAEIWLRIFYTEMDHTDPLGGFTGVEVWDFWWKGHLMPVTLKTLDVGGGVGKHCWARKKLIAIDIPPTLQIERKQILKDLELALAAYKDGGVLSRASSFTFELQF